MRFPNYNLPANNSSLWRRSRPRSNLVSADALRGHHHTLTQLRKVCRTPRRPRLESSMRLTTGAAAVGCARATTAPALANATSHTTKRHPKSGQGARAGTAPATTHARVTGWRHGRASQPTSSTTHGSLERVAQVGGAPPPPRRARDGADAYATFERMYRCACERNSG